ncbi:MAG TPA: ribosome maturation factor RimP [Steroidobacteraceae bacterium]
MLRDGLIHLLEPAVSGLGYELVELEFAPAGSGSLLRLYIDAPPGISLDDCERVSRQVSAILDTEDPIPGQYTLEVSSPGLDRVLRKPEHFRRFAGNRIRLQLEVPIEGRKRFTGTLLEARDDGIALEVDGVRRVFGYAQIHKARLVPVT